MKSCRQPASLLPQGAMSPRWLVTAQCATASALSMSCWAPSAWTRRALVSTVNPRTGGSLNTVATGAVASANRSRMLAASSGALSRRSRRGPGLPVAHGLSAGSALGGGVITMVLPPPPGPVSERPPICPVQPAAPASGDASTAARTSGYDRDSTAHKPFPELGDGGGPV